MAGKPKSKDRPKLDRPAVWTPEAQAVVLQMLAEGNYLSVACTAAGIDRDSFYHWRTRCNDGDPVAQKYADFFGTIKKAQAEGEGAALRRICNGDASWQSSAWFLERRYPQRWGKKDRSPEPPPPKPLKDMTDEEFAEYHARLEGKGRG